MTVSSGTLPRRLQLLQRLMQLVAERFVLAPDHLEIDGCLLEGVFCRGLTATAPPAPVIALPLLEMQPVSSHHVVVERGRVAPVGAVVAALGGMVPLESRSIPRRGLGVSLST